MARTKQTPRGRRGRGRGRGLPIARKEGNGNGNGNGNSNGNGNGNGNGSGRGTGTPPGRGHGHGTGTPPGCFVQPSMSDNKPDPPVQKRKKPYVRAFQQIRQLQRTTKLCISKYQMTRSVFLKVYFPCKY